RDHLFDLDSMFFRSMSEIPERKDATRPEMLLLFFEGLLLFRCGHDREVANSSVPLVDFLQQLYGAVWTQACAYEEQRAARKEQALGGRKQHALLLRLRLAIIGIIVRLCEGATDAILPVAVQFDQHTTIAV